MNLTAIAIVGFICWAIVKLVNGPRDKKNHKADAEQVELTSDLEREVAAMRERIETLEKIVTDEKYDLNRQFDDLKRDKVA